MRHTAKKLFKSALSLAVVMGALLLTSLPAAAAGGASTIADKGKAVATDRKKGNCLACHMMGDGTLPGNIGPPLIAIKARFPEKAKLREQIWDATVANPNSIMIPFGRNRVLSEEEIDQIVEYIYTL